MSAASAGAMHSAQQRWFDVLAQRPVRILVIQRDNIGDLVLVTPFLAALRHAFADARIDALVNSYNADVLDGNGDVNNTYIYTKAKHRAEGQSLFGVYRHRLALWLLLRRTHYDLAVIMSGRFSAAALRPARAAGISRIAAYSDGSSAAQRLALPVDQSIFNEHHVVECSAALLRAIVPAERLATADAAALPPCRIHANAALRARTCERIGRAVSAASATPRKIVAVHISARKERQRWPIEHFIATMQALHAQTSCAFMLLWAPGSADNRLHPGDDEKARALMERVGTLPVTAVATDTLPELIAALSCADLLLCSDGGAMHLAAAQGVPIVALFGNSNPVNWHPWGPPYLALREPSHNSVDIPVARVVEACLKLYGSAAHAHSHSHSDDALPA